MRYNYSMEQFLQAANDMQYLVNSYRDYVKLTVEELAKILQDILLNEIDNFGWDGNNIDGFAFGETVEWWEKSFPEFWEWVLKED